jgi:hypothetical protein
MSQTQLVHITSGRFSLITFGTYCLQVGASSIATAHTNKSSPLPLQILNSLDPHYELSKPLMADTGMWVSMPHHHKFLVLANAFRIDPTHCIGFGMPRSGISSRCGCFQIAFTQWLPTSGSMSVLSCINANGGSIPNFHKFKDKQFRTNCIDKSEDGACEDAACMDTCYEWKV